METQFQLQKPRSVLRTIHSEPDTKHDLLPKSFQTKREEPEFFTLKNEVDNHAKLFSQKFHMLKEGPSALCSF